MHAQEFEQTRYFARGNANPALPLRPALQIVHAHRSAAEHEKPLIRLAEPIVEGGDGQPELAGRLPG